jgi:hypothetical protein
LYIAVVVFMLFQQDRGSSGFQENLDLNQLIVVIWERIGIAAVFKGRARRFLTSGLSICIPT